MSDEMAAFCPRYTRAIEVVGRRWTGAILRALLCGSTRFSQIVGAVPGLSDRLASERLKELEAEGLITRTVEPTMPVQISYHVTQKGQALMPVVQAVACWAETWLPNETG